MVNGLLCDLNPRRSGLGPRDVCTAVGLGRPCDRGLVLVHRVVHGHMHCQLSSRAGIGVPDSRWHVLCDQARGARGAGGHLRLGTGMV